MYLCMYIETRLNVHCHCLSPHLSQSERVKHPHSGLCEPLLPVGRCCFKKGFKRTIFIFGFYESKLQTCQTQTWTWREGLYGNVSTHCFMWTVCAVIKGTASTLNIYTEIEFSLDALPTQQTMDGTMKPPVGAFLCPTKVRTDSSDISWKKTSSALCSLVCFMFVFVENKYKPW